MTEQIEHMAEAIKDVDIRYSEKNGIAIDYEEGVTLIAIAATKSQVRPISEYKPEIGAVLRLVRSANCLAIVTTLGHSDGSEIPEGHWRIKGTHANLRDGELAPWFVELSPLWLEDMK